MKIRSKVPLLLLIILCFLLPAGSHAQTWLWAKAAGDIGTDVSASVTTDPSGNSYITGNIAGRATFSGNLYQGSGLYDVFIAKYDAAGNLLWVKLAGGDRNDQGTCIKWNNGNIYVCGMYEDTALFENTRLISNGESDAFIAKYNDNGQLQWVRPAGGTGLDYAASLDVDNSGNVYIGGTYKRAITVGNNVLTTTNFYGESFYAKLDNNGNYLWEKTTTGNNTNLITGVAYDNHQGLFITGFFGTSFKAGAVTINSVSSSYDIFLAKIETSDGSTDWLQRAGSTYEDGAHGVCADKNGNPTITGYFAGTASFGNNTVSYLDYNDVFVAHYDSAGNNLWARSGNGNKLDVGFGITTDDNGNVYATGLFQNIISFDGVTLASPDILDRDIFVISYSPDGNIRWLAEAGGEDTDCGLGIALAGNNQVVISGYYLHTCSFGNVAIDYADAADIFLAKLQQPVTGIAETETPIATLGPNPCINSTVLTITENIRGSYILHDITGRIAASGYLNGLATIIETSNLQMGVYTLQVISGSRKQTLKLVKN